MEKEDGYALVNHILKNISLPVGMHMQSNCKNRCMMEDRCKSINIVVETKGLKPLKLGYIITVLFNTYCLLNK